MEQSNSETKSRKSPRADFHNYSGGDYFVTICTRDKECFFGKIHSCMMYMTPVGVYCQKQLDGLSEHYPYAKCLLSTVMPNHIHAIIRIDYEEGDNKVPTERTALSVVVGGLKRAVSLYARRNDYEFGWQQRYHDHIIRNIHEGNRIAEYIDTNVVRWGMDCFYK